MLETNLTGDYKHAINVMSPALETIISHYTGWGKSEQLNDEHPKQEINQFLSQLDIFYPGASKRKLKLAIRSFITKLACFKYRVIATNGEVWNPLESSYSHVN